MAKNKSNFERTSRTEKLLEATNALADAIKAAEHGTEIDLLSDMELPVMGEAETEIDLLSDMELPVMGEAEKDNTISTKTNLALCKVVSKYMDFIFESTSGLPEKTTLDIVKSTQKTGAYIINQIQNAIYKSAKGK